MDIISVLASLAFCDRLAAALDDRSAARVTALASQWSTAAGGEQAALNRWLTDLSQSANPLDPQRMKRRELSSAGREIAAAIRDVVGAVGATFKAATDQRMPSDGAGLRLRIGALRRLAGLEHVELRMPDLSRPEDMADPKIRLQAINNYCAVLLSLYADDAQQWNHYQDEAAEHWRRADKSKGQKALDDPVQRSYALEARRQEETCDQHFERLCLLADAAALSMPETLAHCKVITPSPNRLHRRGLHTDWDAFALDLKRLQIEAKRMMQGDGSLLAAPAPAHAPPTMTPGGAASTLGVAISTVYRMIQDGRLTALPGSSSPLVESVRNAKVQAGKRRAKVSSAKRKASKNIRAFVDKNLR